ncbi:hypothetical protein I5G63_gp038 [Mycobacterium phage Imvubu]|uniref:Uncharacterized protein n=1 Tax=Mycobacterium phage Imvubu TaxID=2686233 RepID=A0A6B9LK05_9CAUD|nr:hypothetical protein I5G63_gp038 [Mycobacterium phage Imvubu]QHB37779.1 hypothetical protein PBI_IMVUBU_38 [Mycobacterium phage Imvubu]
MGSPFNTPAPRPAAVATDAQIVRAIVPALERGVWRDQPESARKYVERCAVLNTVIGWALAPMNDATPAEISRVINGTVGRSASYGERVNAILAHMAERTDDATIAFWYAPLTKDGASKLISWLFDLTPGSPKADAELPVTGDRPSAEVVPAGRYAIDTEDGAVNATAFYKVDRPTEGKWAGFVFVKLMVSDDEQRMSRAAGDAILRKIAAVGAEAAAARYGHELGECGLCGRTLTNDESRARGIGPICAAKAGW